jgi:hypothetical protein
MSNYIRYSYAQLEKFCNDCFEKFGFTKEESKIISDVLLLSDLYGIESHGMQRLARYHKGIEKGLIKPDAKPEVVFETPVSAVIEGHDGMGQLLGYKAMNMAIEKAKQTGTQEDHQAANDMAAFCDRFEKKLHDLELTRMVSLQMGPQIRLVQNNDTLMAEKIQSTITNTIPLWKSQMVLALGVEHSVQAMKAQREVNDMTNEMLKKNAEKLKMATVETAKESERGIVDIETLKHTNQMLIETLDEVVKIQDEGRAKRREAESALALIEGELKQKLLDIRQ